MKPTAPQSWDPSHYLKYANQRARPALDLLARVPLEDAGTITDLGCGAGNIVPYLQTKYPCAQIVGVDSSAEMLDAAKTEFADAAIWQQGDIADWKTDTLQDLIYSNAALHWLDHHDQLFPRLMTFIRPSGVLAVQMPNQFGEPSHVVMREVAASGPWADILTPLLREAPVAKPAQYYDWLRPFSFSIDIWDTAYHQVLSGPDAVLDWISSTALAPLRDALPAELKAAFCDAVGQKLRDAYPPGQDGTTLFAFRRVFIVAVRSHD